MARRKKISFYEGLLLKEELRVIEKQRNCQHDKCTIICQCCGKHFEETEMDKKMKAKAILSVKI